MRFNIDLGNHCNLDFIGCGHFSPLPTEYFLLFNEFEKNSERLSYLTNGYIEQMDVLQLA